MRFSDDAYVCWNEEGSIEPEKIWHEFQEGERWNGKWVYPQPPDITIHIAVADYDCYEESAFILFEQDGKLYEVNGFHCSCFGFEDQWEPSEATFTSLLTKKSFQVNKEIHTKLIHQKVEQLKTAVTRLIPGFSG